MAKTSNRVICRCRVLIEDEDVGQFETFTLKADYRTLGMTATMTLPLYGVCVQPPQGSATQIATSSSGRANARMRTKFRNAIINVCADVKVYCWYEGYDEELVFHGYIEHIAEGFPATIYLRDASFILRFGTMQKGWDKNATLQQIVSDIIPVAQQAFGEERERLGFTKPALELTYNLDGTNVQAVTTPLSFDNFAKGRAPYEVMQYLMQNIVLYGGITPDGKVYIGAGVRETTRPIVKLSTAVNVVQRDIVPVDGRFVDYDVKVTGILKNGRKFTATGGLKNSRSNAKKSDAEKRFGETFRGFCVLNTAEGIQDYADRQLAMLKGNRNKGTITLLMYPKIELLDHVSFDDTVFDIYDSLYYVTGYEFTANEKGFFQRLTVTDQIYIL